MSSPAARLKARRQQRWRARQRAGEIVVTLSLPENEIAHALIQTQRVSADKATDRGAVADALREMLIDWGRCWSEHAG